MKLLVALVLMVVIISGCMESGPGKIGGNGVEKSVEEVKNLSIQSADSLSSYSLKRNSIQNIEFNAFRINVTPEFHGMKGRIMQIIWNATNIKESTDMVASVNLSGYQARSQTSTERIVQQAGRSEKSSTGSREIYQMGNSTYIKVNDGKWSHQVSPMSAESIWGQGRNSQVKILVDSFNNSRAEVVGLESIGGDEAYKLNISAGSSDYADIYNMAQSSANWLMHYPELMPFVDRAAISRTAEIEKLIWISKESDLPIKYQRRMSFKMTPEAVGALDAETGKMKLFNKSVRMGELSIDLESIDLYYDFNKPVEISLPKEGLRPRW